MAISEEKIQIVIDNYFKSECNVDTSIREAFEKGFHIGARKTACRLTGKWIESDIGWKCSECNYGVKPWNNTNFCPNCGSYMGEMKNG